MAQYQITNQPAPIDFECNDDIIARTIQNAKNLLMCKMGEVPYDRYRGFNPALFDLPMQQFEERLLPELDRVMLWEPDVEIVGATCDQDENGSIIITATIEIDIEEQGGDDSGQHRDSLPGLRSRRNLDRDGDDIHRRRRGRFIPRR